MLASMRGSVSTSTASPHGAAWLVASAHSGLNHSLGTAGARSGASGHPAHRRPVERSRGWVLPGSAAPAPARRPHRRPEPEGLRSWRPRAPAPRHRPPPVLRARDRRPRPLARLLREARGRASLGGEALRPHPRRHLPWALRGGCARRSQVSRTGLVAQGCIVRLVVHLLENKNNENNDKKCMQPGSARLQVERSPGGAAVGAGVLLRPHLRGH